MRGFKGVLIKDQELKFLRFRRTVIKVLKNDIVSAGIVLDLVTSYMFKDFKKHECDPRSRPIYVFT